MKIAIISDIHGNNEALDAVLKDIKNQAHDKIFCLGDLAMAGPEPHKTVERIEKMSENENFELIQGNTDQKLGTFDEGFLNKLKENVPIMASAYEADLKELTDKNKIFLASLPERKEIRENGVNILLVHGSPRRNDENITPDLSPEKIEEIIKGEKADIIFCGHTHVPCGYVTNTNQTVVNVGSVGRPFAEVPKSCYASLNIGENGDFEIEHRLVDYDTDTAAKKLTARGFDGCEQLAGMLKGTTTRYPQK